MSRITPNMSVQTKDASIDVIIASPIRRCVSIGDYQGNLDVDKSAELINLPKSKKSRKRARPFSKSEPLSNYLQSAIISTNVQMEDCIRHNVMQERPFHEVMPSYSHEVPKESDEDNNAHTSTSSPVRSIVSCDADIIDDTSQSSDYVVRSVSIESYRTPSISEDDLCCETSSRSSSPIANRYPRTRNEFLFLHLQATKAECLLLPLKSVLSRLMTHPTYNRRGTFNKPVDYVALGLRDYITIVKTPMDLGTIKGRLQANSYLNHNDVANDVRLVFNNAQLYNPPSHPIHEAAKRLLHTFEDSFSAIFGNDNNNQVSFPPSPDDGNMLPAVAPPSPQMKSALVPNSHTCQACIGRVCPICETGCISLEPTLLICTGVGCGGSKIRRGSVYYCSMDGAKAWCQRCYLCLPAVLPADDTDLPP